MRKNKKASMELSVNSIVILVIAVVVMGLILAFIKGQFTKVQFNPAGPDAPVPTTTQPVTVSMENLGMNTGKPSGLKIGVLNTQGTGAVALTFTCTKVTAATAPTPTVVGAKTITTGQSDSFIVVIKDNGAGVSACTATAKQGGNTIGTVDFQVTVG